jgi:hypothetical protein
VTQKCSAGIVTRLWAGCPRNDGSVCSRTKIYFSKIVHTKNGADPTPCFVVPGNAFPLDKATVVTTNIHLISRLNQGYLCPLSPYAFVAYVGIVRLLVYIWSVNAVLEQAMCVICLPATDRYGCASATNHITSKDKLICEVLQGRSFLVPYQL